MRRWLPQTALAAGAVSKVSRSCSRSSGAMLSMSILCSALTLVNDRLDRA